MNKALEVHNSLVTEEIIGRYAIGGSVAMIFHVEPINTFDLDVFISFTPAASSLTSLTPIYDALARKGYYPAGAHVDIGGVPVQFLPVYNRLAEEALDASQEIMYGTVPTRVIGAEYLIAIALQTGRLKDRMKVQILSAKPGLDFSLLDTILAAHNLTRIWESWNH